MKYKSWKILTIVLLLPCCLAIAAYIGIGFYYRDTYTFGTYINGVYATGQTTGKIDSVLKEPLEEYVLEITDLEGNIEEIRGGEVDMSFHYEEGLQEIIENQKTFLWGYSFWHPSVYEITGRIQFDHDKAADAVKNLNVYKKAFNDKNPQVKIMKGKDGYTLRDDTKDAIDTEKLVRLVLASMEEGETELNLAQTDCLKEYKKSSQMEETLRLFQKIDKMQSTHMKYVMNGRELTLQKKEIADFIATDEKGEFLLDSLGDLTVREERVEAFVTRLSDTFDTLGKEVEWKKAGGGSVLVDNATFGCAVDKEAEIQQITTSVLYGIDQEREPFLLPSEADIGTGEIGNTYIEVDMSEQMLYYYTDGVLYLKTDVVTGATNRGRGTPEKVCYVYGKQRNRTLRGADYAAFVNYWMPVYGNIGIHDAKWRKEFGGDIYKNGGSHGCINLPKEAAEKIYDKVEVGTPVVMYY